MPFFIYLPLLGCYVEKDNAALSDYPVRKFLKLHCFPAKGILRQCIPRDFQLLDTLDSADTKHR